MLEDHIGSMRLRWFGHVTRMPEDRLPHYLLNWTPRHGKHSVGRQKRSLQDVVLADAERLLGDGNGHITFSEMQKMATDRKNWKKLVTNKHVNLGAGYSTS